MGARAELAWDVAARARRYAAAARAVEAVRGRDCGGAGSHGKHAEQRCAVECRGAAESRSRRRWKQRGDDLVLAALMSAWARMD